MPVITFSETGRHIEVPDGGVLFEILNQYGLNIPSDCGGKGQCGKCVVRIVTGNIPPPSDEEMQLLERHQSRISGTDPRVLGAEKHPVSENRSASGGKAGRLACRVVVKNDITISTPHIDIIPNKTITDVSSKTRLSSLHGRIGCAVDVGTTTVGMYLVDVQNGRLIAQRSFINPQVRYGYDVMTRMQKGADPAVRRELQNLLKSRIINELLSMCEGAGVDFTALSKLYFVGNTVMGHFLSGADFSTLARIPFRSPLEGMGHIPLAEIFSELPPGCEAVFISIAGGFIGSDVAAGIAGAELYTKKQAWLYIDFGTNGEIVLGVAGRITAAAAAAGPAFEGAHLTSGTIAVPGAIFNVSYRNGEFSVETIGGLPPAGLCGSGAISLLHTLVKNGIVSASGRFDTQFKGIRKRKYDEIVIAVRPDRIEIVFTQEDIREIQLAKAAIAAGIVFLLSAGGRSASGGNERRVKSSDIDAVYITGSFGVKIDAEDLLSLGIIPEIPPERIQFIDNAAGRGAIQMICDDKLYAVLETIASHIDVVNLGEMPGFQERFIKHFSLEPFSM